MSSVKPRVRIPAPSTVPALYRDSLFYAALFAAIPVWAGLLLINTQPLDLRWPVYAPWRFTLLVLLYPVLEEIVFRGLIQDSLQRLFRARAFGPLSLANLLTSILFVAAHFISHPPLWAAAVLVPSLLFGFFRERHQSLRSPIVLHVFYNLGYFWLFGSTSLIA